MVSLEDADNDLFFSSSEDAVKRGVFNEQIAQETNDVQRLPKACGVLAAKESLGQVCALS